MSNARPAGIHHVTAIAGDPRRNLAFHTATLGLRLVKRTVNFDDPGTHHLYFGNEAGAPGTILTFFPWAHAAPGRPGAGELGETSFRVPVDSLSAWADRLAAHGAARTERFGDPVLTFHDPDGMRLALVGLPGVADEPSWTGGPVPGSVAIRGFHGVTLSLADAEPTAAILTDVFGFVPAGQDGDTRRLVAEGVAPGGVVDLRVTGGPAARPGRGSVHHLAFRAPDDAAQAAMADALLARHGLRTTGQKDRDYFRSVYVREPGGVLLEIATDIPGFAVDEDPAALGTTLQLPHFLRDRRAAIERALPPLG